MTASGGLYPRLTRHFKTMSDLAKAGCMSRTRARECLDGVKTFTEEEKKAISANILMQITNRRGSRSPEEIREMQDAERAWSGQFDEIYKTRKVI